jgi:archaemetzincin
MVLPILLAPAATAWQGAAAPAAGADAGRVKMLTKAIEVLRPLHKKLGPTRPGDWLVSHPEPGQTFEQYLKCDPVVPKGARRILYIQPLGDFTDKQRKVLDLTADFMGRYFSMQVKVNKDLPMSVIPAEAQRNHPAWGMKQILTRYVLDKVLKPRLADDAFACIALTATDLWPGEGWNFVFGEASLRERVGVWSMYRFGDPDKDDASFRLCLLRTLKTAVHETGHMMSMEHCTAYECGMCGSNNLGEADRRPLASCPECMAKVCWATGADPAERYRRLAEFCEKQGLKDEAEFYTKSLKALDAAGLKGDGPR